MRVGGPGNPQAPAEPGTGAKVDLTSRVHMYARPTVRDELIRFFTEILGVPMIPTADSGPNAPSVVAFSFGNGASLSVEFTEPALGDDDARRGAWLELAVDDPKEMMARVLGAGLRRVNHPTTRYFYFAAPGGQVFRIVGRR